MVENNANPLMAVDLPSGWDLIPLGSCVTEKLSYGVNAPAIPYSGNHPSYIRITDITEDGQYCDTDRKSVITQDREKYSLRFGDIVLARTGASTGKSYLYDENDGELIYAGFLIKASVDTKNFNPRFIFEQLRTQRYWTWVSATSMRSGQPGINGKEYSSFLLPIAPIEEQDAIAETLLIFNTHINSLAELIEKKKSIRDGALEDLISGRTRLDEFEGERKEYTIDDITLSIITGGTPSTVHPEYWGGNIPWLSSTEIHQKRITRPTTYITDIGLQNSSAKMAPSRSVLIALAGQGKTRGTAAYLTSPMALNQSLAALVTNEKCNPEFLFFIIESMYLSLRELSSGDGGRGGLNKKLIEGVMVTIPVDVTEQEAIAAALTAMDEEIKALETERDKMIQIREGAMDDLLTGRVRLIV
ncbi:MAG TPA: restriction endonuclease subunit S [Clostridiales bacterium]|nr:restriction endonuclease subunit S [Clostridiales bacterium]